MARISFSHVGNTPFERLLGHNPMIMDKWNELEKVLFSGHLDKELKEQVRRVLAFGNGCEYCMAKGKPVKAEEQKISVAVAFADYFIKQDGRITDSIFDVLRQEFNEEEISELCAFICFITASQKFGAIMDLKPDSAAT